ncbi:ADAMTS9 [Symbiodinium natans]|uniref:ADAMTS9 protein n=1 Tax=Symbiodinium natans TaxID=878477 RepID=A0A812TJ56_9DINO|nr:ADAMTS9 [Symbiodinium natans]
MAADLSLWQRLIEVETQPSILREDAMMTWLKRRVKDPSLSINRWVANLLNRDGSFSEMDRVMENDQLLAVGDSDMSTSDSDALHALLESPPEKVVIRVGRPCTHVKSLARLRGPSPLGELASAENSALFLLRCSADSSLVLSCLGYNPNSSKPPPEQQAPRWAATRSITKEFEDAYRKHDNVLFVLCFKRTFAGILRMSGVADLEKYGGPAFWAWNEDDLRSVRNWGALLNPGNFPVTWFAELDEDMDSCPRLHPDIRNSAYLNNESRSMHNGHRLDARAWWKLLEHLAKCKPVKHAHRTPEITVPPSRSA